MTSASQCSMARYPERNPISPVMPTSYGLSYSTNSLPRNACTTGAFSAPASAMSWSCAPEQPAPARIVTAPPFIRPRAGAVRRLRRGRQRLLVGADDRRGGPDRMRIGTGRGVGEEHLAGHHD